jgi:hypothetical protein
MTSCWNTYANLCSSHKIRDLCRYAVAHSWHMRHQPKQVVFFGDRCVVAGLRVLDAFEQSASPAWISNIKTVLLVSSVRAWNNPTLRECVREWWSRPRHDAAMSAVKRRRINWDACVSYVCIRPAEQPKHHSTVPVLRNLYLFPISMPYWDVSTTSRLSIHFTRSRAVHVFLTCDSFLPTKNDTSHLW